MHIGLWICEDKYILVQELYNVCIVVHIFVWFTI